MDTEREAPAAGAEDDQIFARPAWLEDFRGARTAGAGAGSPEWRDDTLDPPPRGGRADDDLWDDEPSGWRSTVDRVRTTPRAALALITVGVIAAIVAAVAVFGTPGGGGGEYPVVDFAGASSSVAAPAKGTERAADRAVGNGVPSSAAAAAKPPSSELVVAVVGMVRAPGLHRLRAGARVADALNAARGALNGADTASLNLAQPLRDGDQVVVGVVDPTAGVKLRSSVVGAGAASGGAGAAGASAAASAGGLVNINTAGPAELDRLPGVGAATAAAIIAYRDRNGPFAAVDDLAKVSGIGDAKLAKIKPMATV
ncbi:ComEA family DNA-binding protein [Tsukamurella sp. PLM1]|uniref:ComEA family DNA-binding protein n=1 Tax=Tsukamurella sp. PLM1 TaxID=2929795 RepID=UPI0020BED682|nr:ComEA family DNA-binding protein [Tsukamurella sp. PLM1]